MTTKPPPSSMSPKGVPTGGNGKYIVLVVVLLGAVIGLVVWKKTQSDPPPITQPIPSASASSTPIANRRDDEIPPPPPPDVTPDAGPAPKQNVTYVASNGCEAKSCSGKNTPDLDAALQARARMSKRCYMNALASDNTLQGKMSVALKIGSNGTVCNASIASNDLGSPVVANCVANAFRSAPFPSPAGGCVEATVPLNFVQGK